MLEKQFRRFYKLALRSEGNTSTRLLQLLELRVDNVVYRLGLAKTRAHARQLVNHGHVVLNGKKHTIPSTILSPNDELVVKEGTLKSEPFKSMMSELSGMKVPEWLERFSSGGKVTMEPTREMMDQTIRERIIIEFYSK